MADTDRSNETSWRARFRRAWYGLTGSGVLQADPNEASASAGNSGMGAITSLVAGFPQPTVVLGSHYQIVAFNEPAGRLMPALRLGEQALVALRSPDLASAIRRAGQQREAQRVELSSVYHPTAGWRSLSDQ